MKKNDSELMLAFKGIINSSFFKDITSALKSNGKSKSVEDFNILDEYQTKFSQFPSLIKITHEDCDFFLYDKLKKILNDEFNESKIIFNDKDYDLKNGKYITTREIWSIANGYILDLWTSESKNIYPNPEIDIKLDENEQLIETNTLLVPPNGSIYVNKDVEKKIINAFKLSSVKEYIRNTIGMMSVDGNGELYVKDFSLDKKFKIHDLDIHYGEDFRDFHNELFKKLKSDKKGLVLLHGDPGTGKCVHGKTKIITRDKNTGEIKERNIEDLM